MEDDEKKRRDYIYNENLQRLKLLDRYNKKPRSQEEEKEEEEKRKKLANAGSNTFISFDDLKELSKKGEKIFLPPDSKGVACLSCGEGRLYHGSMIDIHKQLQSDLKADPENKKLSAGLARINQELLAKPHLLSPEKEKSKTKEDSAQEQKYNTLTPFQMKPGNLPK